MTRAGDSLRGYALDGCFEEDGGCRAVDVVVAVDEDGLACADGLLDAGHGDVHAEHQARVEEIFDGGIEKSVGGCGISQAAGDQKVGDGGWAAEMCGEGCCSGGVSGGDGPLPRPRGCGGHLGLLVDVAVVDYDAAEVGDALEEALEAVVPVGGDLEDEHDSLVGKPSWR